MEYNERVIRSALYDKRRNEINVSPEFVVTTWSAKLVGAEQNNGCRKDGKNATRRQVETVSGNDGPRLLLSKPLLSSRDPCPVARVFKMLCVSDTDLLQGAYDRALVPSSRSQKPRKTINIYGRR